MASDRTDGASCTLVSTSQLLSITLALSCVFPPLPNPSLSQMLTPFQPRHRADDLIPEESEVVQSALKRLPPKEAYDRVFRMRRAFQVSCMKGG